MPNFFIIGAQKAGTTSLYHYLAQHPQVYMSPVKEPRFFDYVINSNGEVVEEKFESKTHGKAARFHNVGEYAALFRDVGGETAVGEASTSYIYTPGTAERIKRHVPEAKIVALLRNPADRAYSAFLNAFRYGGEPLSDFTQALRTEEERIRDGWHHRFHYRTNGLYHAQLQPFFELFGRERVGVWLYEDLRADPTGTTRSVSRFLGADDSFVPDTTTKHNPATMPRSATSRVAVRAMDAAATAFLETFSSSSKIYPLASKMRQRIQGRILVKPPPIDPEVRAELIEWYREDILKLERLIGRNLSVWLQGGHGVHREGSTLPDSAVR